VMIRESLNENSPHAFSIVSYGAGAAFQRRTSIGGDSDSTGGPDARAPMWVGLERKGNIFISSISTDGVNWTKVGEQTIEMGASVFAGIAVTAHNNNTSSTATFDHVKVETGGIR